MRDGLKVDYGQKIGKTIIFAKNHDHAEKILEVFNKQYPELSKNGQPFAKVIDNYMTYAQSAIPSTFLKRSLLCLPNPFPAR